jgi:hypothetical protein
VLDGQPRVVVRGPGAEELRGGGGEHADHGCAAAFERALEYGDHAALVGAVHRVAADGRREL